MFLYIARIIRPALIWGEGILICGMISRKGVTKGGVCISILAEVSVFVHRERAL